MLGLDLHTLLHRGCKSADCPLRGALEASWNALPEIGRSEFELLDPLLGKAVKVELRLCPGPRDMRPANSATPRVCIASDVTQLREAQEGSGSKSWAARCGGHSELSNAVRGLRAEVSRREQTPCEIPQRASLLSER
jgi:hypothetical protein